MQTHACTNWISLWLVSVAGVFNVVSAQEPALKILLRPNGDQPTVVVEGLTTAELLFAKQELDTSVARAAKLFSVYLRSDSNRETPLFGTRQVEGTQLIFQPRFPLKPGVEYTAVLTIESTAVTVNLQRPVATEKPAPTLVTAIFPSGERLPQNVLRFYIHFSQPMSRGESYTHIELQDSDGNRVKSPFLELPQELWDPQQLRFSLLLDPGRIKKELSPRRDLGPPLLPGKSYTLVVNDTWRDAQGNQLADVARKTFLVDPPLETQLALQSWNFDFPVHAGQRSPLKIQFDRPMNRGMLWEAIRIETIDDEVTGTIKVVDQESGWEFTPDKPWRAAEYTVVFDSEIEDLAGNRLSRPFEIDLTQPPQKPLASNFIVGFVIRE